MSGDEQDRFRAQIEPHFQLLHRAALRLTRNPADADDLLQDVCLRAYSRFSEFEKVSDQRASLMRVQYRLFIDRKRRRARSPVQFSGQALYDEVSGDLPPLDDVVLGAQMSDVLAVAWAQLSLEQQALLALHAVGHGLDEIGLISGLPNKLVSARLYRSRKRLAKLLKRRSVEPSSSPQLES